jgi:hypothetical protein
VIGIWLLIRKGGSLILTHKKNRERLRQFIDRNDLVDICRIVNPIEQRYSWRQRSPAVHCRLDFFLVSVGLGNITRKTDISYGFKSDHSFISLEIDKQNLKRGKGFYKFNTSLLLDSTFKDKLQKLIPEKVQSYREQNLNPNLLWELIRCDISGLAIKYSSELRKHENENIKNIEKELKSLEALYESMENADLNIETKLLTLKNLLKSYFEKIKQRVQLLDLRLNGYMKQREILDNFFNLEKRNYINKSIQSLVTDNGQLVSEFKDVLNEQLNFYSSLYSSGETVESWDSELVDQCWMKKTENCVKEKYLKGSVLKS